jgi:hypothetical protein
MNVDSGLLQTMWKDNMLFMESLKPDPLINAPGLTQTISVGKEDMVTMPDSVFVDLTPKDRKGKAARYIKLIFMSAFDMDPIEGNTQFIGNEGQIELKYTSISSNDWAAGITRDTFGIDFRELAVYGAYDKIREGLGRWLGELRALYARQALYQTYSQNLTSAPVSLTQRLAHNWYVPSIARSSQPSYDATAQDHIDNVCAGLVSAGTSAVMDVPEVLTMCQHLEENYLQPVTIAGEQMYVFLASNTVCRRMRDPSVSNSWGAYYNSTAAIEDVRKVVPGAQFIIDDKLIFVRDTRAGTLTRGGNATAYSMTFGYDKYGRKSTKTSNTGDGYYDLNVVLGKGALAKYEPEAPHYEEQPDEYTKYIGDGLFGAVAYTAPEWNFDSGSQTDTTAQQESSWVVPTVRS